MSETEEELLSLNQELLESIVRGDWDLYQTLCDPLLTCFEPEARGQLVEGMPFHQFYFSLPSGGGKTPRTVTMTRPHVRLLGPDAAVVSYVRLTQSVDAAGAPQTSRVEETRVWQRQNGHWRHVHFHRSGNS
jgi:calcium/calmodulin-dependent protein kinase (CaM kinase) II